MRPVRGTGRVAMVVVLCHSRSKGRIRAAKIITYIGVRNRQENHRLKNPKAISPNQKATCTLSFGFVRLRRSQIQVSNKLNPNPPMSASGQITLNMMVSCAVALLEYT